MMKRSVTRPNSSSRTRGRPRGTTAAPSKIFWFRLYLILVATFTVIVLIFVSWTISTLIGLIVSSDDLGFQTMMWSEEETSIHILASEEDTLWSLGHNYSIFCAHWSLDMDEWWGHNPVYEIVLQNSTHQCFAPVRDDQKRQLYQDIYRIQFPASCEDSVTKHMTGSGWGVDMSHVVDGLLWAYRQNVTVLIAAPIPWQYTTGVHGSAPVPACPKRDLSCYFLPLTNCSMLDKSSSGKTEIVYQYLWKGFTGKEDVSNFLWYGTRAKNWLRDKAVHVAESLQLPRNERCTVMHVRRADVVLHGKFSRRYHAISEYFRAFHRTSGAKNNPGNILLLTDDANAIHEATTLYPQYKWYYLDRPRHNGADGGWENQIPSNDPALEVVMLHAEFHLVTYCQTIVHSKSNLADYFYAIMLKNNPQTIRIDIDAQRSHWKIHNERNVETVLLSEQFHHDQMT